MKASFGFLIYSIVQGCAYRWTNSFAINTKCKIQRAVLVPEVESLCEIPWVHKAIVKLPRVKALLGFQLP